MLRSGYTVSLYANNGWSGVSEQIEGAYTEDKGEGTLKCQKLQNKKLRDGGINSFRIR